MENRRGDAVYVRAKSCIVDDAWATVGSDNVNRRSWTQDSELTAAVLDDEHDLREPTDPGGLGLLFDPDGRPPSYKLRRMS